MSGQDDITPKKKQRKKERKESSEKRKENSNSAEVDETKALTTVPIESTKLACSNCLKLKKIKTTQ